ncbi:MAG TPA: hypothetical protein VH105_01405 [Burkholderiales bacterium]|nr:hypothetical protein [Burkholderiales bacterium]
MILDSIELIGLANSVEDVLAVLRAYGDTLGDAALPQWWRQLPLADAEQALWRLFALEAIVHAASKQLDERRRSTAKRALQVFAAGVWKIKLLARAGTPRAGGAQGLAPEAGPASST